MPRFIIERNISGAETLTARDLIKISRKAVAVIRSMRKDIQWIKSSITDGRFYCEYIADNEETIREHSKLCEFPVSRVSKIYELIDPTYAE